MLSQRNVVESEVPLGRRSRVILRLGFQDFVIGDVNAESCGFTARCRFLKSLEKHAS